VHEPNTGFTCSARRGRGAFAGDRRLRLEAGPLNPASNIALRVPIDPALAPVVVPWLHRYKFRGFGSVALHLAFAAVGALDLVLDHKATLWDIAGGAAILLEAGGRLTDPRGRPLFPPASAAYRGASMPFLAGNRAAYAEALSACRGVLDPAGDGAR
jgi:myo-inositol-1(or 4)-monophosphatase